MIIENNKIQTILKDLNTIQFVLNKKENLHTLD